MCMIIPTSRLVYHLYLIRKIKYNKVHLSAIRMLQIYTDTELEGYVKVHFKPYKQLEQVALDTILVY